MHAQAIIQDFLARECPAIHAKRRHCLSLMTDAAQRSALSLVQMSKSVRSEASMRHRLKRVDRMLSNKHLAQERIGIYRALARRVLQHQTHVGIIVDWSDLLVDNSQHVLRAAVVAHGRAIVLYDEVHPTERYGKLAVHRRFMATLRNVLPAHCQPVIITDAGFRATWFKMLNELGFAWIGRIRNRDMVRMADGGPWQGCKRLYADTKGRPRDLGCCAYARANPVPCRLVMLKQASKKRQHKTARGNRTRSSHSKKHRAAQSEPWLLAVAPSLSTLGAAKIVALYAARMQIEQTFRDLKNGQWGMGLRHSQTRQPARIANLLLIGALLGLALWLIGLCARATGYRIAYGSKAKATTTVSILTLARQWLTDGQPVALRRRQLDDALIELASILMTYEI
jgi:hypothetical protein